MLPPQPFHNKKVGVQRGGNNVRPNLTPSNKERKGFAYDSHQRSFSGSSSYITRNQERSWMERVPY